MLGKDGLPVPDADMCAKFLRAHSDYLMTGNATWPYVNSARAIKQINDAAADMLEGKGAVDRDVRLRRLEMALMGIVGYWRNNPERKDMGEFIERAEVALGWRAPGTEVR